MNSGKLSRRAVLCQAGLAAGALAATPPVLAAADGPKGAPRALAGGGFRYCLNTGTIRGQNLTIEQEIDVVAQAGYDAIEPWLDKLHRFVKEGGSLKDLRRRIEDRGLTVESAIGFANWIVDEEDRRIKGFEDAKRDMDVLAQIGGKRLAAPPAGASAERPVSLENAARRYRQLLEAGDQAGVVPPVEMWGANRSIGSISAAVFVAIASGHPKACFLGDVYHIYKGGSDFSGLRLLGPQALQVFHLNDYPADPPRETIRDEHRVYPGDGVAPLGEIFGIFRAVGAVPVLSLEVFNRDYWKREALDAARTGLEKMKAAAAK